MIRYAVRLILVWALLGVVTVQAYIDNPFLAPLQEHVFWRTADKRSYLASSLFVMTASEARDCYGEAIPINDLGGVFDLAKLNSAMNAVGISNPLFLSEWATSELPYRGSGKIHTTGIDFAFEYALRDHFSCGALLSLMHVNAQNGYCITTKAQENLALVYGGQCYTGREIALEQARLNANKLLNVNAGQWSATGLSDMQLYVRADLLKEYRWKLRVGTLNALLGVMLPTGEQSSLGAPSSVPFGANGHTGIYGRVEAACELTDDIFLGVWVNGSKRFAKTHKQRLPMGDEPLEYGVLVDYVKHDPGAVFGFSPYLMFDDIQDGFGAYCQYLFAYHFCDSWCYNGYYKPNLNRLINASQWVNEFFTVGIDYDFTKTAHLREYGPRVFGELAIPANLLAARRVVQNWRVSLGVEFHF